MLIAYGLIWFENRLWEGLGAFDSDFAIVQVDLCLMTCSWNMNNKIRKSDLGKYVHTNSRQWHDTHALDL